jgi:hypothetical protein
MAQGGFFMLRCSLFCAEKRLPRRDAAAGSHWSPWGHQCASKLQSLSSCGANAYNFRG